MPDNVIDFSAAPITETNTPIVTNKEASENSFFAASLSGEEPISAYRKSVSEYQQTNQSTLVENTKKLLQEDDDKQRSSAVMNLLGDNTVPKEQRKAILEQYLTTRTVPVSLRDKYAEKIAVDSPKYSNLTDEEFSNSFFSYEIAAAKIDKRLVEEEVQYSTNVGSLVLGTASTVVPFLGSFGKNYNLNQILEAIDPTSDRPIHNFFFGGDAKQEIRDKLRSLPPEQQVELTEKLITTLKDKVPLDVLRYLATEELITNPEYGKVEKFLDNYVGLFDVAAAGVLGKLYKAGKEGSKKAITRVIELKPSSPLGTTAVHNAEAASKLGVASLLDETGELTNALGESKAAVLAETFFQQADEALLKDAPSGARTLVADLTGKGLDGYVRTETSPILYTQEVRDAVKANIYESIQSFKQLVYHQSKSSIKEGDDFLEGVATFGKGEEQSFRLLKDAEAAAEDLRTRVPHGEVRVVKSNPETLTLDPVTKRYPGGEFYVQWKYSHEYNPLDTLAFGPVKASLKIPFGPEIDISSIARAPYVGRFLLPGTHVLDSWIGRGALQAGDAYLALEKPILKAVQKVVSSLSRIRGEKRALADLIEEGSDEGKVFSYGEISGRLHGAGFSQKQVDKVYNAYVLNRRADEIAYLYANRKAVKKQQQAGAEEFHLGGERPVFAKRVARPNDVSRVWDETKSSIVSVSKEDLDKLYSNGGTLGKLTDRITVGREYVNHVIIPVGTKAGKISDFILPRLEGHSPRYWQEYYFVDRRPLTAEIDGKKYSSTNKDDLNTLDTLRTTHAASGTKAEAEALRAQLEAQDSGYQWSVRRERRDETSIETDFKIYSDQLAAAGKRGDKLISIDGHARMVDPLLARYRSIQSIAKSAAFGDWIEAFQVGFMKKYSRYLNEPGVFPTSVNDFKKPVRASIEEVKEFKDAITHFNYFRSQVEISTYTEDLWKQGLYWMGEHVEKFSDNMASVFKEIGNRYYPPNVLKRINTALFIALRPFRQIILQPAQLLQMAFVSPEYVLNPNKFTREFTGLMWGMGFAESKHVPRDLVMKIGAKLTGVTEKQYEALVKGFKDSGLPDSVDTNLLVSGVFNQGHRALVEGPLESAAKNIGSAITAIPRGSKAIGFDLGEFVNLAGSFLFARERHLRLKPNIPWDSKLGLSNIAVDARQLSGEVTRGAELSFQRGALSLPFQFLAVPYKLLLGMTTSKFWTPAEKSKLIAGNLVFFGAAGVGVSSLINSLREEYGDFGDDNVWTAIRGGVLDLSVNHALNLFVDDKDDASVLALSKGLSPIGGDAVIPISGVFSKLSEKPFREVLAGPSWTIFKPESGKLASAIRDISGVFSDTTLDTPQKIKRSLYEAAELASGGTDWMKYRLAVDTGRIVSSQGLETGLVADRKTALGKLFGFSTYAEGDQLYLSEKSFDEDKEIRSAAKYIVSQAQSHALKYGTDEWATQSSFIQSYLSFVATNPDIKAKLDLQIERLMLETAKNQGDSIHTKMYKRALTDSEEQRKNTSNFLRSSPDPRGKELADRINELTGVEGF